MKYTLTFALSIFITSVSANTYYNSNEVNNFINHMYEKHDFKKDELRGLFNNIKDEKKLKKFYM